MGTNERPHEVFVASLLQCGTIKEAAAACGVPYSTARRWMDRPDVKEAYEAARRELVRTTLATLQVAMSEAVETLRRNLDPDQPAAIQVRAAQILLENAIKTSELLDLDVRLRALEEARADQPFSERTDLHGED